MNDVEQRSLPVTQSPGGKILWCGEPVSLDQFPAIRKYCDDCLEYDVDGSEFPLTIDWELLAQLIQRVDREIPWFTAQEEAQSLKIIPTPPPSYRKRRMPYFNGKNAANNRQSWIAKEAARKKRVFEALRDYSSKLGEWRRRHEIWNRLEGIRANHGFQKRSVERLSKALSLKIKEAFSFPIEQVNWEILPPGDSIGSSFLARFTAAHSPCHDMDPERLEKVVGLRPDRAYRGVGDFDGYLVFLFGEDRAVLECPKLGNAAYLLTGNWRLLSRLSKAELLSQHAGQARRVIHRDGTPWFDQVRDFALGQSGGSHR